MKTAFSNVQALAKSFLEIADSLNEKVSNYFDGSNAAEDENAYYEVKAAEKAFVAAYNAYYDESHEACLDYSLAESVIY